MTLVDSNIFMYAAGREHPFKRPTIKFLESVSNGDLEAAIDAEVLQEILHRYRALGRWDAGKAVYDTARALFPTVISITGEVMDEARHLLEEHANISARDAIHAAVVQVYNLQSICSFDADFDKVRGLRRIEPK